CRSANARALDAKHFGARFHPVLHHPTGRFLEPPIRGPGTPSLGEGEDAWRNFQPVLWLYEKEVRRRLNGLAPRGSIRVDSQGGGMCTHAAGPIRELDGHVRRWLLSDFPVEASCCIGW